jgi:hypothetical protein
MSWTKGVLKGLGEGFFIPILEVRCFLYQGIRLADPYIDYYIVLSSNIIPIETIFTTLYGSLTQLVFIKDSMIFKGTVESILFLDLIFSGLLMVTVSCYSGELRYMQQ